MQLRDERKTEGSVSWVIHFDHGHVSILARSLITGQRKVCEYDCNYNFRDGYDVDTLLEVYRILDSFKEELENGQD